MKTKNSCFQKMESTFYNLDNLNPPKFWTNPLHLLVELARSLTLNGSILALAIMHHRYPRGLPY